MVAVIGGIVGIGFVLLIRDAFDRNNGMLVALWSVSAIVCFGFAIVSGGGNLPDFECREYGRYASEC